MTLEINNNNYGTLEVMISSFIFYVPFLLIYFLRLNKYFYLLYGYIIILLLIVTITNIRFNKNHNNAINNIK